MFKVCKACGIEKPRTEFWVNAARCKPCAKIHYAIVQKAAHCAKGRARYQKNKEAVSVKHREWREKNKERIREYHKEYYRNNPDVYYERQKKRLAANPGVSAEYCRTRQARKRNATPPWVDREELRKIYRLAAKLGMTVDHIYPLKGKNSCGLHVPWNLQILSKSENSRKGTKILDVAL